MHWNQNRGLLSTYKNNVIGNSIEYIPSKTIDESGKTVSVPLISQAQKILMRYKDVDRDSLFPFISIQHYNKAIKKMLKKQVYQEL